jgi:hypothetical protein
MAPPTKPKPITIMPQLSGSGTAAAENCPTAAAPKLTSERPWPAVASASVDAVPAIDRSKVWKPAPAKSMKSDVKVSEESGVLARKFSVLPPARPASVASANVTVSRFSSAGPTWLPS